MYFSVCICRASISSWLLYCSPLGYMHTLKMVSYGYIHTVYIYMYVYYNCCSQTHIGYLVRCITPYLTSTVVTVLRYKLSKRLSACIQDRPCPHDCGHRAKKVWATVHLPLSDLHIHVACLSPVPRHSPFHGGLCDYCTHQHVHADINIQQVTWLG